METNGSEKSKANGHVLMKKQELQMPVVPPAECEAYEKHARRGIAVILNHKHFDTKFVSTRQGTDKDRDDLAAVLKELKFDVTIYNDLSFSEIISVLDVVSKMDHSTVDCLVVAVMSHGDDGILYAKDTSYPTRKLWTSFSPLRCPSLTGKPKIFFIQACRGDDTDPGVNVRSTYTDFDDTQKVYSIPLMADILIMYATVEGYYAWRHPVEGSYFIQSLVRQLRKHYSEKDLLSILTCVNRDVAFNFTSTERKNPVFSKKKEMCSIVSMLTRDFHLN